MTPPTTPESESTASGPSPRAFCHATGYIFQGVGMLMALAMCCWWPASCWQDRIPFAAEIGMTPPTSAPADAFAPRPPESLWAMFGVTLTFVGGLGLFGLGFGLQQDKSRTAHVLVLMTGIIGLFFWVYLGFAIFSFPSVGRIATSALMALVWTVCFLLSGTSNEELRKHPPTLSEQSWTSRDEDDFRRSLSPDSPDKMNP